PAAAGAGLFRVGRSGGGWAPVVGGRRAECGWREPFPVSGAGVESEVSRIFFNLVRVGALANAMVRAGFEDVRDERWQEPLPFESADAACGAALAGGAAALAYGHFDEPMQQAVRAEYLASIEPYRHDGAYDVPGEFVIAFGRKE